MILKQFLLLGLLSLAACSAQAEPPKPLLWKISDGDNEVYLLGSVHLLNKRDYPLAPSVDAAFADAEALRLEISPEEMNNPDAANAMLSRAMLDEGKQLQQMLPAQTWSRLERYAKDNAKPIQAYQMMKPWFVALLISIDSATKAGMQAELGLDRHFANRAKQRKIPSAGFETVEQQISIFDSMSVQEQVEMLSQALDEDQNDKTTDEIYAAWRAGDDKKLWAMFSKDAAKYPELMKNINEDRNRAWVSKIKTLLAVSGDDKDTLVVVGALHLVGDVGLPTLLKKEGFTVERIR